MWGGCSPLGSCWAAPQKLPAHSSQRLPARSPHKNAARVPRSCQCVTAIARRAGEEAEKAGKRQKKRLGRAPCLSHTAQRWPPLRAEEHGAPPTARGHNRWGSSHTRIIGISPKSQSCHWGEGKFSELCAARATRGGRERSSTELAPEGDNTALPSPPKKTPEALGWPQIWGLTAPPPPPRLPADEQRVLTPGSDEAASRAAAGHAGLRIPSKFHPNSFVRTRTGGEFRLTGTAGARGLAGLLPTPTGSAPNSQRSIEAVTL